MLIFDSDSDFVTQTIESDVASLSLAALNANVIIDMRGYATLALNISSMPASSVVSAFSSQDGLTNWVQVPFDNIAAPTSQAYSSQVSTAGSWLIRRAGAFLKLEMTTYGGSGTLAAQYQMTGAVSPLRQVAVVGSVAHSASAAGNPVPVSGVVQTASDTTLVAGDAARLAMTAAGQLIVKNNADPALEWSYAAASGGMTATADVSIKGAVASNRNFLTDLDVVNSHASVDTEVVVKDGSTIIWRRMMKAGASTSVNFRTPLKSTANTALNIANITTGAAVYVNAAGYVAP